MTRAQNSIIEMLRKAYCMQLETVMNCLAVSVNLDGVRAGEIKKSLGAGISAELMHTQQVGARIRQPGGLVPGSASLTFVLEGNLLQLRRMLFTRLDRSSMQTSQPSNNTTRSSRRRTAKTT